MTIDTGRRRFLSLMGATATGLALPGGFAWAAKDDRAFWSQPRRLRLYRSQTSEWVNEVYWADGRTVDSGYVKICHLLRDVKADQTVYMDPRLLDLMRAVQGYMEHYGFTSPIMINSGYRSPLTNARTEGAARHSMHVKGKAVDFTMPGVPSNYLGALASHYQGGGVGFYFKSGFTHMDTGNVRYWSEGGPSLPKMGSRPESQGGKN